LANYTGDVFVYVYVYVCVALDQGVGTNLLGEAGRVLARWSVDCERGENTSVVSAAGPKSEKQQIGTGEGLRSLTLVSV